MGTKKPDTSFWGANEGQISYNMYNYSFEIIVKNVNVLKAEFCFRLQDVQV